VRGTDEELQRINSRRRFIPARAGNRPLVAAVPAGPTVHPRPCGEQPKAATIAAISAGSSPPVRGTVVPRVYYHNINRFIPARAGNRIVVHTSHFILAVHPRPCGEQSFPLVRKRKIFGSSPPVRGTVKMFFRCLASVWFIPARAGNSFQVRCRCCVVCGSSPPVRGTGIALMTSTQKNGSSPPVRGTDHGTESSVAW